MEAVTVNVLYVYGDILQYGGIESFMMNYFRYIDKTKIHIDFVLQGKGPGVYDDEIRAAGSEIYYLPKPGHELLRYIRELCRIYKTGRYKIVHAHCDAMNHRVLKLAKRCGVPIRISHAHNTDHVLPKEIGLKHFFYDYSRNRGSDYATARWACSREAGIWMYGKSDFSVIPNAIELNRFLFDKDRRNELRKKYRISEDVIVLGHVGRFDIQKNQGFLVDLLQKLMETGRKYKLLFLGTGWMKQEVEDKVRKYHLEENVLFAGEVSNPQDYYHMMDIYVMPSLFEGYGIALEEAEVNGLPCLASDKIPREVDVLGQIAYLPLDIDIWRKRIERQSAERNFAVYEELKRQGYDIVDAARKVQDEYVRMYNGAVSGNG